MHAITAEEVTLNLKSADIGTLISTVSEVTGKNFVVDPRVKGKVTVISSRAMEKEELYQVFLSILQVHGFAAVTSGKVIKILPDASAKQSSMPFATARIPGTGDEIVTRVLQVNNVAATQLVPLIRPLVPQQGHLAAYGPTNVLIISDRAANIDRLITIIQRVDQVSDSDIEIIPLEYASATEVVRILTSLAPKTSKGKAAVAQPVLVADERTNSVILSGDRISRLRMRTIISHLDTPLEKTGNTHVVYLHYAKAKEMATILTELSKTLGGEQQGKGKGAGARNEIGIQSDETTNALVITAPHEVFTSIQSVIRQLDIRRSQVMVDAILAEVTLSNLTELGIQWRSSDGTNHNDYVGVNLPGTQSGSLHDFEPLSASLRGLSVGFFRKGTLRALIRALTDDSNTNILGKPTLVTLDNEEAEIVVGQNVPFITGQYSNDNSTPDNPFQTIKRQDVGVVLKVTPQINEGDSVRLEIFQEISTVDADTSGAGLIT
ncbi:MAG: type II secretion system secretin GspD, partial [Gammaproteobacteria bacterium]|nr:type II secretion system secretin GspD [Gammaproteobacteria bacterium]